MKTKINFYYTEDNKKTLIKEIEVPGNLQYEWVSTIIVNDEKKENKFFFEPMFGC